MRPKRELNWRTARKASLAALTLAVGLGAADAVGQQGARRDGQFRVTAKPIMAIVSLRDQRITVYDSSGRISEAPVSTGSTGYETPAGIFSIVQKKEFHQSNLYEDGDMPFMQRITWTGIALHAGVLPGHPASHGCIRMPMAFAERLYGLTETGMRVIVVRDDMAPGEISHPILFKSRPVSDQLTENAPVGHQSFARSVEQAARIAYSSANDDVSPGSARHLALLKSIAAARSSQLQAATKREREANQSAARKARESASALRLLRAAEANHAKAEALLKDSERRLGAATSPASAQKAEAAKAKALARATETKTQLDSAQLQAQAKSDAAERARMDMQAAVADKESAAEAADEAERNTAPVSVFISRQARRLYVRKANYPIYEGPITIRDADSPIGTFVFTALGPANSSGEMRWSVVSMYKDPTNVEPALPQDRQARASKVKANPNATDIAAANSALDRIKLSKDAIDRISEVVLPGSSLIISDEAASIETGKDTDFVVIMSAEPQGALKVRQREPRPQYDDEYSWGRSPYRGFPDFFPNRRDRPRQQYRFPWW